MNFPEYIKFIMPYKEILRGFPIKDETFAIHFDDCNERIKDFELFKKCWKKHTKISHFFPSSIELVKLSLPDFPELSADEILRGSTEIGLSVNNYLCEKYGLALPNRIEISNSMQSDYNNWLESIRFYLPKFIQDYKDLKVEVPKIFNERVLKELNIQDTKRIGEQK